LRSLEGKDRKLVAAGSLLRRLQSRGYSGIFKEKKMNPKVDQFLINTRKWREEMTLLREIVLSCKLNEEIKWMHPCYTLGEANIVLIHGFKEYCALLFFKGVLMKDPKKLLIQQTANVQERRQLRFRNIDDVRKLATVIRSYIKEAIRVEKEGLKVVYKKTADFAMPEEFRILLEKNKKLMAAFERLTPGRQKGYLLYFNAPKQTATRERRIEKYLPAILAGKGIND
jgi:uncharacterized protein YdeI (YjbR/CyaY-like superfamily)